jgi:hypothetical protein
MIPFNWQKSSAYAHCPISSRFIWCYYECDCHLGIDSRGTQWKCPKVPQRKGLVRFKSLCKNVKNAIKSEKGLLFDAIREQFDKIIEEGGFDTVPNRIAYV